MYVTMYNTANRREKRRKNQRQQGKQITPSRTSRRVRTFKLHEQLKESYNDSLVLFVLQQP